MGLKIQTLVKNNRTLITQNPVSIFQIYPKTWVFLFYDLWFRVSSKSNTDRNATSTSFRFSQFNGCFFVIFLVFLSYHIRYISQLVNITKVHSTDKSTPYRQKYTLLTKVHPTDESTPYCQIYTLLTKVHSTDKSALYWQKYILLTKVHLYWQKYTCTDKSTLVLTKNTNTNRQYWQNPI